jgi:hypothetical protein
MEWVLAHMEDQDFNDPLPGPTASPAEGPSVSAESVESLSAFGFTTAQVCPSFSTAEMRFFYIILYLCQPLFIPGVIMFFCTSSEAHNI